MKKIIHVGLALSIATFSLQPIDRNNKLLKDIESKTEDQIYIDSIPAQLLKNINLIDVIKAFHELANLQGISEKDIVYKIHQILAKLPDIILGVNITNLKNNKIDAALAPKITDVLPSARAFAEKLQDPKPAVILFNILYYIVADDLPESIANLYRLSLDKAIDFIESSNSVDQNALEAIKRIINKAVLIISNLYKKRNNLVNYDLTEDHIRFTTTLITEFPSIQAFVKKNLSSIQEIIDAARKVTKEDIITSEAIIRAADLKKYNLQDILEKHINANEIE